MKAVEIARWFYKNNIQVKANSRSGNIVVQKLCYYSQAMYMAVYNKPLFEEKILAWENGPVINEVYTAYRWYNYIIGIPNDVKMPEKVEHILKVVNSVYGVKTPEELIESTHAEMPWKQYENVAKDRNNNPEIDKATINNYYKDLKQIYEANKDNNFEDEGLVICRGCNFSYMKSNIKNINDYKLEIKEFVKKQVDKKSFNIFIDKNGELEIYD